MLKKIDNQISLPEPPEPKSLDLDPKKTEWKIAQARRYGSKCTPELAEAFCAFVTNGFTNKMACEAVGLSEKALYTWRKKGEAGEEPYYQFVLAWRHALNLRRAGMIQRIIHSDDTRDIRWYLSKTEESFRDDQQPATMNVLVQSATPTEATVIESKEVLRNRLKGASVKELPSGEEEE